ncbi:MAG: hypothetical protein KA314_04490 [Chloroflexi bacterium]|nr:hypothetical protein [Chloroflexota bacterium]
MRKLVRDVLPFLWRACFQVILFLRWIPKTYHQAMVEVQLQVLEKLSALACMFLGVWVGTPLWDTFTASVVYRTMAAIAPEWVWGSGAILIGMGQLVGLYRNDLKMRYMMGLGSYLFWSFVALMFLITDYRISSTPIYILMAASMVVVAAKLRQEHQRQQRDE